VDNVRLKGANQSHRLLVECGVVVWPTFVQTNQTYPGGCYVALVRSPWVVDGQHDIVPPLLEFGGQDEQLPLRTAALEPVE
jgi:hypothetical protein